MSVTVSMPQLGESVTEGTVTRWLRKEGERVEADEPLLEVSTDKVDTEIPSPVSGVLRSITVAEDETVAVGAPLAVIDEAGAAPAAPAAAAGAGVAAAPPAAPPSAGPLPAETAPGPPDYSYPAEPEEAHAYADPYSAPPEPAYPAGVPAAAEYPAYPEPVPVSAAPVSAAPPVPPAPVAAATAPPAEAREPVTGSLAPPAAGPYVTPLVRKLAAEHGVDLAAVAGTGVGGRVRKQDVLDAARTLREQPAPAAVTAASQATPVASGNGHAAVSATAARAAREVVPSSLRGTSEKLSRGRQLLARRMVESLHTAAQLTTVVEADVSRIARLRSAAKAGFEAREGVKLSFLPFFALAAVEALKIHPKLNAVLDTEASEVVYHDAEHLGIAVDAPKGLMVPVVRNAGDLNIGGLARKIADLAERTRAGKVGPDELAGGTFTLTNTGSRGALFDTPIINQPQVAILGTGTVVRRPVVIQDPGLGEVIAVRSMVYLALTYDHRLIDGADAARFLTTVKDRLEEGAFEAELGL